jgi:hypothetical protein
MQIIGRATSPGSIVRPQIPRAVVRQKRVHGACTGPHRLHFLFLASWAGELPSLSKFQILSTDLVPPPGGTLPMAPLYPWLGSHANPKWGRTFFSDFGIKEKHSCCLSDLVSRCTGRREKISGVFGEFLDVDRA